MYTFCKIKRSWNLNKQKGFIPPMDTHKREKKIIFLLSILCILLMMALLFLLYRNNYFAVFKQMSSNSYDYKNNAQYTQRQSLFEVAPKETADLVFVGDSITARGEWQEFFPDQKVLNRGIDSDVTEGVLNRLDVIINASPKQIFLMIGINDIRQNIPQATSLAHYEEIIKHLKEALPDTELYIQSILPIGANTGMSNKDVEAFNQELEKLALEYNLTYIDLYSKFLDHTGFLPTSYSIDGVHLTGEGYTIWIDEIKKCQRMH